uniref:Uncharacterized protein n=1 Tax=Mustela putorius furo TaxID=9669 RepID=M3XRA1_MUSPF
MSHAPTRLTNTPSWKEQSVPFWGFPHGSLTCRHHLGVSDGVPLKIRFPQPPSPSRTQQGPERAEVPRPELSEEATWRSSLFPAHPSLSRSFRDEVTVEKKKHHEKPLSKAHSGKWVTG